MNQLDGAGPPPASKDQIDALPMTTIVQDQVGELHSLIIHLESSCLCITAVRFTEQPFVMNN